MKTAEFLRQAKALIEHPDGWTKGQNARDESGEEVDIYSPVAKCYCVIGALYRACDSGPYGTISKAMDVLRLNLAGNGRLAEYNDDPRTTHADIMAMFDRSIAYAEGKGHASGDVG